MNLTPTLPAVKTAPAALTRGLVLLMAVANGLIVANLYYLQPVLADVARTFGVAEGQVGTVATLSQLGYAVGLLLLVPLGDTRNRRTLIIRLLLAVTVALLGVAVAPNVPTLAVAAFAVGALTIGAQIMLPFAASLARPEQRGQIIGMVMSGLLIGILLARTVSGYVGGLFGWRAMFYIAAAAMLVLATVLRVALPDDPPRPGLRYGQLLRSLGMLVRTQPVLREACMFAALSFGAFNAFWVTLVFFLEQQYGYGSEVAGLFGLVGVAGALAASITGKLADRMDSRQISGLGLALMLIAYVLFWLLGGGIWWLVLGVVLLDLGQQSAHIANQTRVYALLPEARSRLNTVYIVSAFLGGSAGTALGTAAWSAAGWAGVCAVGAFMGAAALALWARRKSPARPV